MELLPDARFRCGSTTGHETLAYSSGKMKKNRIRILAGDRVTVEMTPMILTKVHHFRHKDTAAPPVIPGRSSAAGERAVCRQVVQPFSKTWLKPANS